jgi:hypothetical protein
MSLLLLGALRLGEFAITDWWIGERCLYSAILAQHVGYYAISATSVTYNFHTPLFLLQEFL